MRKYTQNLAFLGAMALASLIGCSGGFSVAPKPVLSERVAQPLVSHYSCPLTGAIVYLTDGDDNLVDVYSGKFSGQKPCGQLTAAMHTPRGVFVQQTTHDLYVANTSDYNILVFHRGQMTPYNIYVDRYHGPFGVLVGSDGTIVDIHDKGVSTWIAGPNGGTFVGEFPLKTHELTEGFWMALQSDGTIFYDVFNYTTQLGELWSMTCPRGECHHQTQVAGVSYDFPGGIAFDRAGNLLLVNQGPNRTHNSLQTFNLPNPAPSTFPLLPGWPTGMTINRSNLHVYVADEQNHNASEYLYPSGTLVGTVACCTGTPTGPYGIAIDP